MKHILTIISTALLLLSPVVSSAQQTTAQATISGVVSDDMRPLMGATVTWENKDGRTISGKATDNLGNYILVVPAGEKDLNLVFSFVGYKSQTIKYTGQTKLNVTLVMDAIVLDAAVVETEAWVDPNDAFGRPREEIGYPSEIIDITQFQEMAVVSVEEMLIGKVAGLDIIGDGDPGTLSTIRIRGTGSLNANNEPLIVIDGVPQDTQIDPDFDFSDATVENFGSLVNMSPNDIQNIEVLKDASATALWGDQAANGVLLITTRQGGKHTPYFTIQEKVSYTMKPTKFNLLNGDQYKVLMQDAMWNRVRDNAYNPDYLNELQNQKDILYDQDYNYFREYSQNTDWLDLVTQAAINNTTDFTMSGGGDKASYFFSLGYTNEGSSTVGADYERITSRLNVTYKFSKKFRVQSGFSYGEGTRNQAYQGMDDIESPRAIALKKMPNMSPWVLDTDGNPTDEYFSAPNGDVLQSSLANPLALVEASTNREYSRNVGAQFNTTYDLFKNFSISAQVSFDMKTQRYVRFLPESAINVKWSDAKYNKGVESMSNNSKTYLSLTANYKFTLPENHTLRMMVGERINAQSNNSYELKTSGNGSEQVSLPSSGGKVTGMGSSNSKYRDIAVLGSATYGYKGRYYITFSGRISANSNRALGSKWGNFNPTMDFRWNMKKEPWLQTVKWISDLRISGSFGRMEKAQDLTKITGSYTESGWYGSESWESIYPDQMQLYNLKPEIETSMNFSFGGELFNKLSFNLDYYQRDTKDQYQTDYAIVSSTGFTKLRVYNAGRVQNRGIEGSITYNDAIVIGNKESKNKVTISFQNVNFARNRNRIMELPTTDEDSDNSVSSYTLGNGNIPRKAVEGTPIGSIFGFEFDGIYQDYKETYARDQYGNLITDLDGKPISTLVGTWTQRAGDVRYKDQNYDGVIDQYDIVYVGSSYPSITGGATVQVKWKKLSFRAAIAYRLGHTVYNEARLNSEQMSNANNQSTNALARWRYKGEITEIPRALWGTNYNSLVSDQYIEDASFVKLKDITVNYALPDNFVKKLGLKKASMFFNAYNLLTFTKYSGVDPEIQLDGTNKYSIARDRSKTPPARKFLLGVRVEF